MKLSIIPLSQRDARWSAKKLGGGGTIGQYGCLLTCHSMCLIYYGHQNMTPDVLNEVLKQKGVYDGNYINFYSMGGIFGDYNEVEYYDCQNIPCDLTKVDNMLAVKMPVIAMVDFDNNPSTKNDSHFVLIIGKTDDNHYIINDPWTGEEYFFDAKYGNPEKGIYGLRIYKGNPPQESNCQDKIDELLAKLETANETVAEKSLEVNTLRDNLEKQEKENDEVIQQLNQARVDRDTAIWEKQTAEANVERLSSDLGDAKKKNEELTQKVVELKEKSIDGMGKWELLILAISKLIGGGK